MITEQYRKSYTGEFIVLETSWRNGAKHQTREWIPNTLVNSHISKRAAVIGSNADLPLFDYRYLEDHRGGLLRSKSLQTYGTDEIWRDLRLDFYVSTDQLKINKLLETDYYTRSTVFTNSTFCLRNPGKCFLIPFAPAIVDLAKAVYLACFDGHREIFLIGYNKETPGVDDRCIEDINSLMTTYRNTNFVLVGVPTNMPETWRKNRNVRCMKYKEFRYYCDV